ncbi:Protein disulfide-isomerase [Colletotrichum tanaceti]|uniref:Protein disulfide-isomerase n=1 Tax=Colletotrichum tanaceti TaxID=1306861 RepID=A0A4U6XG57_9PEZI|nr:Protein disulfide-isomerase [Colletotrichum tanaceti]
MVSLHPLAPDTSARHNSSHESTACSRGITSLINRDLERPTDTAASAAMDPINPSDYRSIPFGYAIIKAVGRRNRPELIPAFFIVNCIVVGDASLRLRRMLTQKPNTQHWILLHPARDVQEVMHIIHHGRRSPVIAPPSAESMLSVCYTADRLDLLEGISKVWGAILHVDDNMTSQQLWNVAVAALLCKNDAVFFAATRKMTWLHHARYRELVTNCNFWELFLAANLEQLRNLLWVDMAEIYFETNHDCRTESLPGILPSDLETLPTLMSRFAYLRERCDVEVIDREGESYQMVVAKQADQTWPYRLREEVSCALVDMHEKSGLHTNHLQKSSAMDLAGLLGLALWVSLLAGAVTADPGTAETALIACKHLKLSNGNSKRLEGEWKAVRSSTTGVAMRWDDDLADESCSGLGAYPAIRLLRGGRPPPERILRFIERVERSPHGLVNVSAEDVVSFQGVDDFVCIGHFPPGTALRQAFEAVADKYRAEFTFGVVVVVNVVDAKVVCHKRDDQSVHTWTSGDDGLEAWLVEASRPVIAELTPAKHQRLLDRGWPMVYILSSSPGVRASVRADLHAFAKNHYASLTAVTVDPGYFPDLPARLGLDPPEDGRPVGAVHQLSNGRVYRYPEGRALTPRELQAWGLDVWQGRVKPWAPPGQEPAPDAGSGSVRVVRSHNLKVNNMPGVKIRIGGRERDEL